MFDSLKDEIFEQLRFELFLNEISIDEGKPVEEKFVEKSEKYGTICGVKLVC